MPYKMKDMIAESGRIEHTAEALSMASPKLNMDQDKLL